MSINAEQARAAIKGAEEKDPEQLWSLFKSLLVATMERVDKIEAVAKLLVSERKKIQTILQGLVAAADTRGGGVPASAPTGIPRNTAAPLPPQQAAQGSLPPRPGADGQLITDPEQLAAEAEMDVAMGLAPAGGAPTGAPSPSGLIPRRAGAGGSGIRTGADGQPVVGEQLAAEEAMDAALGQ